MKKNQYFNLFKFKFSKQDYKLLHNLICNKQISNEEIYNKLWQISFEHLNDKNTDTQTCKEVRKSIMGELYSYFE